MDDDTTPESTPTVTELAGQLRAYADALESMRAGAAAATVTDALDIARVRPPVRQRRLARVVPAAAAAVVAVGAIGWWAAGSDSASLSTDDPAATATTVERDPPALMPGSELYVLPDMATWAVTDHSETTDVGPYEQDGIWVWRLNGSLVTLSENVPVDEPAPREQARLSIANDRMSLHWVEGDTGFDLQGIGVDEATLRAALAALTRSGTGWELPGAELVASEEAGPGETGASEQITIVPRDDDGVPVLSARVQSVVRPGSPADLYRELHEASGGGTVSDVMIAGEPGFTIIGPDFAYALVAADGWVVNWSTADPELDFAGLLASVERVTPGDWSDAVAGIDAAVAEVVAAAGIELVEATSSTDLPRYTLPEPWAFEWVTDMGIWTPEQQAQRQALNEANTSPQAVESRPVRAQGFRSTANPDSLPITVPDVVVEVWEYDGDAPPGVLAEMGGEPYSLGGLQGNLYPEGTIHGRGAMIELSGGNLYVAFSSSRLTQAELRAFADSLSVRGEQVTAGFDLRDTNHEQLFDLEGSQVDVYGSTGWHGAWQDSEPGLNPTISVERASRAQLQWRLMNRDNDETTMSSIEGGRYLAITIDNAAIVMRHDASSDILTTVTVVGTVDQAVDLMEQLIEVDLAEWSTLVGPVNADPLRPR